MQRKEFIKRLGFGSLAFPMIAAGGNSFNQLASPPIVTDPASSNACEVSPGETSGPFPTKSPSSLVVNDIRAGRTGIEMAIKITIQNKNENCAALSGAMVDIWHCDKDGYYSEYGGSGMQSVNFQSVHFLRGRQITDAKGLAFFKSIFPGWYGGRSPHIHVHIYNSTGKSLLVTQIAFPSEVCDIVYTKATQFYTKGIQDTPNASDFVFANSLANQMGTVTGSISKGFVLTDTIVVNA